MKACIFDLDGVLVDTAKYHFIAWKKLANSLGFSFTEIQNEELKGISRVDSLNKLLGWGNIEKSDTEKLELATLKNDWYIDMIAEMTPEELLPGSKELLSELKENGIKIALGSASKNAPLILEKTGISPYFDAIVDGNSVSKSKPDPEVFLLAAKLVEADPQECIVFEDAQAGVEAGKRAGMKVIGIGKAEDLRQADFTVGSLAAVNLALLQTKN
ncbi:beta-phosphoglucomutase [Sphingobacterium hungaricum]|uniref:Beta-phosphoglucomutase n=1 Tax=Sphingobacterium hungaricum TaxID=2082723 RepID=A0A928UWN0_9SPHI|nr:beta-phosphoglucomutase [Sphingobacterium hungaricum]MBE8713328.1 beta-phosphoglucomutase [Sphingobacterium hungaricum]